MLLNKEQIAIKNFWLEFSKTDILRLPSYCKFIQTIYTTPDILCGSLCFKKSAALKTPFYKGSNIAYTNCTRSGINTYMCKRHTFKIFVCNTFISKKNFR